MAHNFDSWGRLDRKPRESSRLESLGDPAVEDDGLLAFGNGRSYGDSCHNDDGRLIPMRAAARIHAFDPGSGILEADAGVTLNEILEHVIPHGFFLEVTPGTALATLGGAVANDVHGKNHHRRGSFGHSVISFSLLRSDGSPLRCSRQENTELFAASIGGMGLTGVMTRIRIRLMKVASPDIEQVANRFDNIDGYFDRIDAVDRDHEYSVAWIDQHSSSLPTVDLPVSQVAGRVLGREIVSGVNVPGFARSMMDGYAIRAEDSSGATPYNPLSLEVQGEISDLTLHL